MTVGTGGADFNFSGSLFQWTGGTIALGSNALTNAGTINVSGGSKSMSGTVVNQGLIAVAISSYLGITGTFNAAGGAITGPGYLVGCVIEETASPAAASTILIEGDSG